MPPYGVVGYVPPRREHKIRRRLIKVGLFVCSVVAMGSLGFSIGVRQKATADTSPQASIHSDSDTSAVAATPVETVTPTPAPKIVDLQPILDAWAKSHPNQKWGIAVKSLDGPSFTASYQADQRFETASVYKLFLTLPLFQKVPVEKQAQTYVTLGDSSVSVAQCLDKMIRNSDNACGQAIGGYVGWSKATQLLNKAGFTGTDLTSKYGMLVTTPNDAAKYLEQLNGNLLPTAAQQKLLGIMSQQIYRKGIPAGCPTCQVADKVGFLDDATNDAAIVTYPGGKYVLAIFSNNNVNFPPIAQLTAQIQAAINTQTQ